MTNKNGPYLDTKKVGKNNPKAENIKADNEIRMEWNRTVDRAIVSGVSETEVVELKKTEITDRVKGSVEQNGSNPELFGEIVKAAIALLEKLIAKVMQKVMDLVEKAIDKAADAEKETPKETEIHVHAKDEPAVQAKKTRIPFPVNLQHKMVMQNKAELPQKKTTVTVKKSIIEQIKAEQKSVPAETKQPETEKPPQPKPSILTSKYPRLKEIDNRLKEQNKVIFEREKKRDKLKKELSECTGIFKGGRRKELQQEIVSIDVQISNMKKSLFLFVIERLDVFRFYEPYHLVAEPFRAAAGGRHFIVCAADFVADSFLCRLPFFRQVAAVLDFQFPIKRKFLKIFLIGYTGKYLPLKPQDI